MANAKAAKSRSDLDTKYITFSMGEEEYGVPVLQVVEIVRREKLIPVPHARDELIGLMDIRGAVLPLINLKARLGLGREEPEGDRAIVMEMAGRRVALAVDRVSHVEAFPEDMVDTGPTAMRSASSRFILGVGKKGDRFVILLDLRDLFGREELQKLAGQVSSP